MKVLSLGWGTQSFTLAAMVALGELEMVDYAIHSDTTHESKLTYDFAKRWTGWLKERGVNVVTVTPDPNRVNPIDNGYGWPDPPFFADGGGMIKRQCTTQWKIIPMKKFVRKNANRGKVEQWIGISLDEFYRMKPSRVKYIKNVYPLVDKKMTRHDCKSWLNKNGLEIPPRSACIFCPFHSRAEWRETKKINVDWEKAVEIDKSIRKARPPLDLFVCNQYKPLDECDFDSVEDKGQMTFQWQDECTGYCGN